MSTFISLLCRYTFALKERQNIFYQVKYKYKEITSLFVKKKKLKKLTILFDKTLRNAFFFFV